MKIQLTCLNLFKLTKDFQLIFLVNDICIYKRSLSIEVTLNSGEA